MSPARPEPPTRQPLSVHLWPPAGKGQREGSPPLTAEGEVGVTWEGSHSLAPPGGSAGPALDVVSSMAHPVPVV